MTTVITADETMPEGTPLPSEIVSWVRATDAHAQVCVHWASAARMRALHRQFFDEDSLTNVLSFPEQEGAVGRVARGDIALCRAVLANEAAQFGLDLRERCAHLVIHGTLHLQGYEHKYPEERQRMEALESQIMTRLGFRDPWA